MEYDYSLMAHSNLIYFAEFHVIITTHVRPR